MEGLGFCIRLQEELIAFEVDHSEVIDGLKEDSIKAYTVALLALTKSIWWMHGFILFVDSYYWDLTKAKFGTRKAWHIMTCLAKQMLDNIALAGQSGQGSFIAGDPTQVCQKVVWRVLKAHDTMADFKKHGFKHHPVTASELVKFLAINTSFKIIEHLETKVTNMDKDITELKKVVARAVKATGMASNTADSFKPTITKLDACVAKIEKKVF
jgi:hypothetical protein